MHDPPRILVVDDEPNIRELVQARLERNGYEVVTAADGYAALAKTKAFHPDLNPEDPSAAERFKELFRAYEILSAPQVRDEYDAVRDSDEKRQKAYRDMMMERAMSRRWTR